MGDRGRGETDVARFWVSSFRYRKNCFLLLFHFERLSFWWHLYADERFENAPHPPPLLPSASLGARLQQFYAKPCYAVCAAEAALNAWNGVEKLFFYQRQKIAAHWVLPQPPAPIPHVCRPTLHYHQLPPLPRNQPLAGQQQQFRCLCRVLYQFNVPHRRWTRGFNFFPQLAFIFSDAISVFYTLFFFHSVVVVVAVFGTSWANKGAVNVFYFGGHLNVAWVFSFWFGFGFGFWFCFCYWFYFSFCFSFGFLPVRRCLTVLAGLRLWFALLIEVLFARAGRGGRNVMGAGAETGESRCGDWFNSRDSQLADNEIINIYFPFIRHSIVYSIYNRLKAVVSYLIFLSSEKSL